MIAHRIARTSGRDRFERLACYVTDLANKRDPRSFDRLVGYIADADPAGERVVGTRISNCLCDDLRLSIDEIEHTQARNTRAKGDKSYHLVFSFPEGERPTAAQLRDIEDRLCEAIGLADHQRISAVHDDTDNLHVHVAISKVHPATFRLVEPYYDHPKLMAACVELELRHGLRRDNHGPTAELSVQGRAAKMEAFAKRESLQRWVIETCADDLQRGLQAAKSWSELHQVFATCGLELRPRGAGLVIAVQGAGPAIKASSLGREFGFGSLTKAFGPFEPAVDLGGDGREKRRYRGELLVQSPNVQPLWARYNEEREATKRARQNSHQTISAAHQRYDQALKHHHAMRLSAVRGNVHMRAEERRSARLALRTERASDWSQARARRQQQSQEVSAQYPLLTWEAFLQREAERGEEGALQALRSRSKMKARLEGDLVTAKDAQQARHIVDHRLRPDVRKNGDVIYQVRDGGRVTDSTTVVRVDAHTAGSAALALSLAAQRFANQPLILEGSDEFKSAIVELSTLPGFDVTFADAGLEFTRQNAARNRGPAERPGMSAAVAYVAEQNRKVGRQRHALGHRIWGDQDVGDFTFEGCRTFSDGTSVVLLARVSEIVVKQIGEQELLHLIEIDRGCLVALAPGGRAFVRERRPSSRLVGAVQQTEEPDHQFGR